MFRKIKFWLARKFLRVARWLSPVKTREEWNEELIWWLTHDKRQRDMTDMATRPTFVDGETGDGGRMMQHFLNWYAFKKREEELKEIERNTKDRVDWVG